MKRLPVEVILTLLIHLGYLAYDSRLQKVTIPNLEVAGAFGDAVSGTGWEYVSEAMQDSDNLLEGVLWKFADGRHQLR